MKTGKAAWNEIEKRLRRVADGCEPGERVSRYVKTSQGR